MNSCQNPLTTCETVTERTKCEDEPSKMSQVITRLGYVDASYYENSNVIDYHGPYTEGKMYPDLVLKCKRDLFKVILPKVTEMHERISKNSDKEKIFECHICGLSYKTIENFYSHVAFRHFDDRIEFTEIEFLSRIVLRVAKRRASTLYKYQCLKCEIKFHNSIILKQHKVRNCFRCVKCEQEYDDCLKWKEHMVVCDHEGHVICDCGEQFSNNMYYKKHKESCKERKEGPMTYLCVICQIYYQDMQNLIKHQNLFHPEQSKHKTKLPVSTCYGCNTKYVGCKELHNCKQVSDANFKCPVCLKVFDSEMSKVNHLNAMKASNASCTICKKRFVANCENSMHVCDREYISSVSLICKICNKSYMNSNEIYKHIKSCHMKNLSTDDYAVMNSKEINLSKYTKVKIIASDEKQKLKNELQKHSICIETYAEKKSVCNDAQIKNYKNNSVKRTRHLEEKADIKEKKIDDLDVEKDLMDEAKRKRKLQVTINNREKEINVNFNEENYQVSPANKKIKLPLTKINEADDIKEVNSFIGSSVKNLQRTEKFSGEVSGNMEWKEEIINYDEENQLGSLLEVKSESETGLLNEWFDDDLMNRKKCFVIDANENREEMEDINLEESLIKEEKEKGICSQNVWDELKKEGIESFSENNLQVLLNANQHPNHINLNTIEEINTIQKEENGNFIEDLSLGEVKEVDNFNMILSSTTINGTIEKGIQNAAFWKKETVDFDGRNTQIFQNASVNEKLNTNVGTVTQVESEIKSELVEERYEGDILTIYEPAQDLQIVSNVTNNIEIKTEIKGEPLGSESNKNYDFIVLLESSHLAKCEQEAFECATTGHKISEVSEIHIPKEDTMLDKEWQIFLDTNSCPLKTELKHIDQIFKTQRHNCSICSESFNTLAAYYSHYIYHSLNKHQCPYCRIVIHTENFYQHCFTHVILNYDKSLAIDTCLEIKCYQCDEEVQKPNLLSHYENHSLISFKLEAVEFPKHMLSTVLENLRGKEKLCVLCEKNFINIKQHLIEHLYADAKADEKETGKLLCQICKKSLCNKCIYKKHMLRHASSPPYECKVCKKMYRYEACFINHKKKHVSACVWCDACEESFVSKDDLIHHLRRKHQTTNSLCCKICKLTFYSESRLDNHTKLVHEEDEVFPSVGQMKKPHNSYRRHQTTNSISCDICKLTFYSVSILDKHTKLVHKEDEIFPSVGQMKKPHNTYGRSSKSTNSRCCPGNAI